MRIQPAPAGVRCLDWASMGGPAANLSGLDLHEAVSAEDTDRMLRDFSSHVVANGPFAPGDTLFAIGHYAEDRDVWFDVLTATLEDVMRECAFPKEQREHQRERCRFFAGRFLRYYYGPEQTIPLLEE